MKSYNRWKLKFVFIFFILGITVSAQNHKLDSLTVNQTVLLTPDLSERALKVPERSMINVQDKDLLTVPIWKVTRRPKFNGPIDLSSYVSDQIIEIDNVFGTKEKSGQSVYEVFIDTKGEVDELKATVSSGEYLDNCFMAAIMETSGYWLPAVFSNRNVRTSIKIKIQYRLEWHATWTKLLITAHEI